MISENEIYDIKKKSIDELRMHFVFNSLNNIRFLIKNEPEKAYQATYEVAKFMRGSIDSVLIKEKYSLEEELSFVKAYLSLEQIQKSYVAYELIVDDRSGFVVCGEIYRCVEELFKEKLRNKCTNINIKIQRCKDEIIISANNDEGKVVRIHENNSFG